MQSLLARVSRMSTESALATGTGSKSTLDRMEITLSRVPERVGQTSTRYSSSSRSTLRVQEAVTSGSTESTLRGRTTSSPPIALGLASTVLERQVSQVSNTERASHNKLWPKQSSSDFTTR